MCLKGSFVSKFRLFYRRKSSRWSGSANLQKTAFYFKITFLNIINLTNKMKNKMKSKLLLSAGALIFSMNVFAQVGINTATPQGTLDVVGKPTDPNSLDGVVLPRLTGAQLKAKNYTAAQTGATVYVTLADPSPSGQTVNVTSIGTYFFTGTVWARVVTGKTAQLVLAVKGTGTQLNTAAPTGVRLAYFSNDTTQTGNTLAIEDPGSWNVAAQTYTAPVSGLYQVVVSATFSGCTGAADGNRGFIRSIKKSGAALTVINTADVIMNNGVFNTNQFSTAFLNAGDQIFVDYNMSGAPYCSGNIAAIQGISVYRFQ